LTSNVVFSEKYDFGSKSTASDKIKTESLSIGFKDKIAISNISLSFKKNKVTAIMGPSGCGKTVLIRSLNRMHDLNKDVRITGRVFYDNTDLYSDAFDPYLHRRRIGMVFQKPNPFPTMSIYDNVVAGWKLNGLRDKQMLNKIAEKSLRMAYLWDEVKDDLGKLATQLSGGQQQRLCIARALAINPEVLLMDEPTASLDPISTQMVENTISELKKEMTIVIITHNLQQSKRVADHVVFMYLGKLIEHGDAHQMFNNPKEDLTEKYLTGKFG
jgi:phosphate transport system ATP-binding protein